MFRNGPIEDPRRKGTYIYIKQQVHVVRKKYSGKRKKIMEVKQKKNEVSEEAKEKISERLSNVENLWFPRAQQSTATLPSQRKSIFHSLLTRDPSLFLERYGSNLTSTELTEFETLKEDYEINWHVTRLRSVLTPTTEELRRKAVVAKNRRRAYLDRLIVGGVYFSEEVMREREAYLHYEYVGKFQDRFGRRMARPGERWSDTLLRRCEEAEIVAKIRGEQERIGVPRSEWIGNEGLQEEEEEEEEEDDDDVEKDETVEVLLFKLSIYVAPTLTHSPDMTRH